MIRIKYSNCITQLGAGSQYKNKQYLWPSACYALNGLIKLEQKCVLFFHTHFRCQSLNDSAGAYRALGNLPRESLSKQKNQTYTKQPKLCKYLAIEIHVSIMKKKYSSVPLSYLERLQLAWIYFFCARWSDCTISCVWLIYFQKIKFPLPSNVHEK
jgi:hypothetical protein